MLWMIKKSRKIGIPVFTLLIMSLNPLVGAEVHYSLILDNTYSSKTGANNILALHRGLYALEGKFLRPKWSDEKTLLKKVAGLSYRLAKTVFLDNVLDHLGFLIQHEVFGHGARYREFGYKNNSYSIHLLFPYGDGKGWAGRGRPEPGSKATAYENIAMIIGGSESNTVLANLLKYVWLKRGSIHYRESIFYLFTANDLWAYIARSKFRAGSNTGNDILSFLKMSF